MLVALTGCASPMSSSSLPATADSRPARPPADLYQPGGAKVAAATFGSIIGSVELSAPSGLSAYAVLYGSTGLHGEPVAVSGLVIAPDGAPPPGGFPGASPFLGDPADIPAWRELLAKNSPGVEQTDVPIVVVAARGDDLVPYDTQRSGVAAMCAVGDIVELRTVEGDHSASFWTEKAFGELLSWIADRMAGRASASTC